MKSRIYLYMGLLALGAVLATVAGVLVTEHVFVLLGIPFAILLLLLTMLLAGRLTAGLVEPLNAIDPDDPLDNPAFEEISPLLFKLHEQNEVMNYNMELLAKRQDEFKVITENMTEGLILLDGDMNILTANPSALRQLNAAGSDYLGKKLTEFNSTPELTELIQAALGGEHRDRVISVGRHSYQLLASPVSFGSYVVGCALLTMDVTEKQATEQLRKEFSANVSHELKTPLTSISGYAEMIALGMAAPEDIAVFGGKILDEARHLIELINDIIKLSRLDEGRGEAGLTAVDLLPLVQSAAERLHAPAAARDISISVDGAGGTVSGIEPMLNELIFNLGDNAVKYNRPGGWVRFSVEPAADRVLLVVEDNGIGIPAAEQGRVFERFYRGDKSHSRENEETGTGLGLAIVKHIARLHEAAINVTSEPGRGSRFEISFPG